MSADHSSPASGGMRRKRALIWAVRLQEQLSPAQRLCLEKWQALPENQQVLHEALQRWNELGQMPEPSAPSTAELAADRYDGSVPLSVWQDTRNVALPAVDMPATPRTWMRAWPIAACIVFFIVVGGWLALTWNSTQTIETGAGEWQTVLLTDGTKLITGPMTHVDVRMSTTARRVSLESGDAYFDVAKQPERPFIVTTGHFESRVVGTLFAVSRWNGAVKVTVKEGRVTITRLPAAWVRPVASDTLDLYAGEQMTAAERDPLSKSRVDAERVLGWTRRELVLNPAVPLADAVRELNRRNQLQIEITDAAIGSIQVAGTFAADDPKKFAKLVAQDEGLTISYKGPDVLQLDAKQKARQ